tara:strand:- start:25835 stop:26458 length:624 start_codon:yes stop_codon:yes gene_type:complete
MKLNYLLYKIYMPKKQKKSSYKKRTRGKIKANRKTRRNKRKNKEYLISKVMGLNAFVNKKPRKGLISGYMKPKELIKFSEINKTVNKTLKDYRKHQKFRKNLIDKSRNLRLPYESPNFLDNLRPPQLQRQHGMRIPVADAAFNTGQNTFSPFEYVYDGPSNLSPDSQNLFNVRENNSQLFPLPWMRRNTARKSKKRRRKKTKKRRKK